MAVKQFDVIQQLTADGPNHNYDLDFILFYMAQSFFSKAHKSDNKSLSYVHAYYSVNMMVNGLLMPITYTTGIIGNLQSNA